MTKIKLFAAVVLAGSLMIGHAYAQTPATPAPVDASMTQSIKILPRKESRALKISRIPGGTGVPMIIGNYWACHEDLGFTICKLKLVVCNDAQTICVQIN